MAYATGTAASPAALQVVIENFAVANGFTLTGGSGGWLSKGKTFVSLNPQFRDSIISITYHSATNKIRVEFEYDILSYFSIGQTITITGCNEANFNGTYTIAAFVGTSIITVTPVGVPAAATATGWFNCIITPNTTTLGIRGANSNDGTLTKSQVSNLIYIEDVFWPVTYHLFYNGIPDMVTCVLVYDTDKVQVITFGDIVKVNEAAYVGGNWFFASRGGIKTSTNPNLHTNTDTECKIANFNGSPGFTGGYTSPIPFLTLTVSDYNTTQIIENIHAEVDSYIWSAKLYPTRNSWGSREDVLAPVHITDYTRSAYFRNPNKWNTQALLVPIHLEIKMAASLYGYIGYIEHLRYFRIGDYNIGDIVTITPDSWMVFPWYRKNAALPNGGATTVGNEATGTLGFAVRYTP